MTMGHFATALVPWARGVRAPAWLLLLCAQLLDFVWFALSFLGVEPTTPASFLDVTIVGLRADMAYSHTGLGALVIAALTGALVFAARRERALAAWCASLVFGHWLCDLVSGYPHEVLVAGTPMVGLGLYLTMPPAAFAIEAAFSGALVAWYVRAMRLQGTPLARKAKLALVTVFVGGSTVFLPTSFVSLRQWLGL